jgi:predicted CXXCH cytochrome family protein
VLAAVCLATLAPAAMPGQNFVGSGACAACHEEIFQRQEASNHALSLRAPSGIADLYRTLPFQFEDKASQARLTLQSGAGGQLELHAGKAGQHALLTLRWAFGSGRRGITPVGVREDGAIIESRLSRYPFEGGYLLTPGATRYDPQSVVESLGRTMTLEDVQQCFSCHTTDYTPTSSGPRLNEMGIRCERCHGAGLEHTRVMSGPDPPERWLDRKILNPGRLKTFAQLEMCGTCHGRPPLDTDLAALQYLERTPQTARYPSRRLVLSRCYNESPEGLKCTLCHDPHSNVSEQRAQRDRACLGCHSGRVQSKARACPVNQSDCVSCHMPRERVMIHSEFTDHWIRIAARSARGGRP